MIARRQTPWWLSAFVLCVPGLAHAEAEEPLEHEACQLPLETARAAVTEKQALALVTELEQCAIGAEQSAARAATGDDLAAITQTTIAAERARKQVAGARELAAQAKQRETEKAAQAALEKAEECRDLAIDKAQEEKTDDARDALSDAKEATRKAERTVEQLDARAEKLQKLLDEENGARKELERLRGEQDQLAAAAAATDDAKKRAVEKSKEIAGRIEALQENGALLTELLEETKEDAQALRAETAESKKENQAITPSRLTRIALQNDDHLSYGITLAAVRLRATRDPDQLARERDYRPKAEFVPTLLGLRIVYEPSAPPWRLDAATDPLQLIGVEFALYIEKGEDTNIDSLATGVGLTLMDGLVGVGIAFDVYRSIPVLGGTARTGIMPWALSRSGEVTAENITLLVTIGLNALLGPLSGRTDTDGEDEP